jgi:hypothetical protein
LAIAVYAAIISTFVLGWYAYKYLAAGAKINLFTTKNTKIIGGKKGITNVLYRLCPKFWRQANYHN